jgi:hypothetical protein
MREVWTTERFHVEIDRLGIKRVAKLTGLSIRALYHWRSGARPIPPWIPLLIRACSEQLTPKDRKNE